MPAASKSQQRLMGMVHAYQKGELKNPPDKIKSVAEGIEPDDAKDFAKTKHKGLPKRKKTEKKAMKLSMEKRANLIANAHILARAGLIKLSTSGIGNTDTSGEHTGQAAVNVTTAPAAETPSANSVRRAGSNRRQAALQRGTATRTS